MEFQLVIGLHEIAAFIAKNGGFYDEDALYFRFLEAELTHYRSPYILL